MRYFILILLAFAAACAEVPQTQRADVTPVRLDFPAVKGFAGGSPGPATRSNADMARAFLDLSFQMESGRPLPALTAPAEGRQASKDVLFIRGLGCGLR